MEIAISIGSNLGDRLANFRAARQALAAMTDIRIVAVSAVYETEPVDVSPPFEEETFLNAALVIETKLAPMVVSDELHALETALGRVRQADKNAPRTLDLDILYAGDIVMNTPQLALPHPRWNERRFVVEPLADIRPDRVLPGESRTVREILATLPDEPRVRRLTSDW